VAHAETGAGRLHGTWDVLLTVRNCDTEAPMATIRELATFDGDGTLTSSTAGLPPATKTPGHGVWHHVWGQTYRYSFKFFRFDAAGAFVGWAVVRQQAVVDYRGNDYTSAGTIELYTAAGSVFFRGCSTTTATRFH
jgi:hypothetical protein